MGATFAAFGVWLPYWPAWLQSRGMTPAQIGLLMAAWSWSRAITGPGIAHFVDAGARRRAWLVATAIASALAFGAFHWAGSFAALAVLSVAYGSAQAGTIPLGEGVTLLLAKERGFSYGVVRAWGSVAFLALSIVTGVLIEHESPRVVQPLAFAFLAVAAIFAFGVPEPARATEPRSGALPLRSLLAIPGLLAAVIGCGIVQAAHATYAAFSFLHWHAAGHSSTAIGLFVAEGVLAEIALFAVARRVSMRFDERKLLVIAVAGSCLRWLALASSTHTLVIVGTQWMHALSFAAAHLALMNFFARRTPPALAATSMALYSTTTHAANALAVALAGVLFERSPGGAFAAMSAIVLIGGVVAYRGLTRADQDAAA